MKRLSVDDVTSNTSKLIIFAYERGYRVSDDGVFIRPDGSVKELSLSEGTRYPSQKISAMKELRLKGTVPIHRFAAYCFYGDAIFNGQLQVRHLNANVLDVSKRNIVLGTAKDNAYDKPKSIRDKSSKVATQASLKTLRKFTCDQVRVIRAMNLSGKSYSEISELYEVDESTIRKICRYQRYKNVI